MGQVMSDFLHPKIVNHGNGASMNLLASNSVDLVLTSPPYFSQKTYEALKLNDPALNRFADIENDVLKYARSLRPVFEEIARVLKKSHPLIIQTKDVRYSGFLIPLTDAHISVARTCGFHLVSRIHWSPSKFQAKRIPRFLKTKSVGDFRTFDSEQFLILSDAGGIKRRGKCELSDDVLRKSAQLLWRDQVKRKQNDHPFASPRPVIKKLLSLFSEPNDLVVDPFCGFGTILEEAMKMGRKVSGWEIDKNACDEANGRLLSCKGHSH